MDTPAPPVIGGQDDPLAGFATLTRYLTDHGPGLFIGAPDEVFALYAALDDLAKVATGLVRTMATELAALIPEGEVVTLDDTTTVVRQGSFARTEWDVDGLNAEVRRYATADPATGELRSAPEAVDALTSLVSITGSTVKVAQIKKRLHRNPDEFCTEQWVDRVKVVRA